MPEGGDEEGAGADTAGLVGDGDGDETGCDGVGDAVKCMFAIGVRRRDGEAAVTCDALLVRVIDAARFGPACEGVVAAVSVAGFCACGGDLCTPAAWPVMLPAATAANKRADREPEETLRLADKAEAPFAGGIGVEEAKLADCDRPLLTVLAVETRRALLLLPAVEGGSVGEEDLLGPLRPPAAVEEDEGGVWMDRAEEDDEEGGGCCLSACGAGDLDRTGVEKCDCC